MQSDEDWAWALRSDAEDFLRASNLSHPLDRLNARTETSNSSLAAIIISTLRRRIKSRFYFRSDDLDRMPKSLANNIKDDLPFLIRPEEDPLPPLEYTHNADEDNEDKQPIKDYGLELTYAGVTDNGQTYTILENTDGRFMAETSANTGFIKKTNDKIPSSQDPLDADGITVLATRCLHARPSYPRHYSFGTLQQHWSWILLPSPTKCAPFCKTYVRTFTAAFITTDALSPSDTKPLWKSEAWKLARSIPNDAALSFLWKYLNNAALSSWMMHNMVECKVCGGEITINHILFHCPISHELWFTFDHIHNLTIPPPRRIRNHCIWREKGNSKASPVLIQLELLHLYHVWAVWWSLQKTPNDQDHNIIHPHSWIRRVLTCYFCMYDPTPWALSPHITPYLEEWKKLHHVDKL